MDSLGGMSSYPSDPKTAVMRQVQQEAAMQNARMLVEVRRSGAYTVSAWRCKSY